MTDHFLMQLMSYRYMLTRKISYQLYVLIDFIYWPIFLVLFLDTSTLFHEFYCNAPAVWIKNLSIGFCLKSVASFCHPPIKNFSSLHCMCMKSSNLTFSFEEHTFAPGKCLISRFCDFEAWDVPKPSRGRQVNSPIYIFMYIYIYI